jgi:hypothetical protein
MSNLNPHLQEGFKGGAIDSRLQWFFAPETQVGNAGLVVQVPGSTGTQPSSANMLHRLVSCLSITDGDPPSRLP